MKAANDTRNRCMEGLLRVFTDIADAAVLAAGNNGQTIAAGVNQRGII